MLIDKEVKIVAMYIINSKHKLKPGKQFKIKALKVEINGRWPSICGEIFIILKHIIYKDNINEVFNENNKYTKPFIDRFKVKKTKKKV